MNVYVCVYVYEYVYVYREREREREGGGGGEREREVLNNDRNSCTIWCKIIIKKMSLTASFVFPDH